jgi:FMN phosphatase YigB (HAD superfamily)
MARRNFDELSGDLDGIKLISTDIFDTLLLRNRRSARSRIMDAETRFARLLGERGWQMPADDLVQARLRAEKLAFRALEMTGGSGEVRLADLIGRQLRMLGLPEALAEDRLAIEIAVEKTSLTANRPFGALLRRRGQAGDRIVGVSDIGLSAAALAELIDHFHGPGLLHRVYSSADEGASKRQGDLFGLVLAAEGVSPGQVLHIGDDETADYRVPSLLGIRAIHVPRGRWRRHLSRADGAATEVGRQIRRRMRFEALPAPQDKTAFGREVLGPIVAEFCLLLWLYADQARHGGGDAALLFCARGGIAIREAFERVLDRLALPLPMRRDNLMVSRLVAARSAVIARSDAALDELGREFWGGSFANVALALGGRPYDLPDAWRRPFAPAEFFALLESEAGLEVLSDIRQQNTLFARHLGRVHGGARRIILCDTGLYGSTQRLLAAGFPDLAIETVQFARCNYKGHSEEHFPQVVGLVVEQNLYNPLKVETAILRYWQLIESLFEPAIPSVRTFSEDATGEIVSNAGEIGYGAIDPAAGNPLLFGALSYIDGLSDGASALRDAQRAWVRLKRAITNPTPADVEALGVGVRSVDFGRSDVVSVLSAVRDNSPIRRLKAIKSQLWREGAIARDFPLLRPALLAALEAAHVLRALSGHRQR